MSKDSESGDELLNATEGQLVAEVSNPDSAFENISIPPYMVRRYVREMGLARKKTMEGGLGFDGDAYTALALSYSYLITKLLAAAKEVMKSEDKTTLTSKHILAALTALPDFQRLLPSVYIGGVGVIPEETLVKIKQTKVGGAVLKHTQTVQKRRHDKANGVEGDPDLDAMDVDPKDDDEEESSSSESDEEARKAEEEAEKAKERKKLVKEALMKKKEEEEKAKKKKEKEKSKEKASPKEKSKGKKKDKDEEDKEADKSESVAERAKSRRKRKADEALAPVPEEDGRRQSKKARKTAKA